MRRYFFILSLLNGLIYLNAQDVKFTSYAQPAVLRVGEQFQLVYELNANPSELEIPELNDFRLLGGPSTSTSSSFQIINGKTTRSVNYSYTYYLQAINEGIFTIPPAKSKDVALFTSGSSSFIARASGPGVSATWSLLPP